MLKNMMRKTLPLGLSILALLCCTMDASAEDRIVNGLRKAGFKECKNVEGKFVLNRADCGKKNPQNSCAVDPELLRSSPKNQ